MSPLSTSLYGANLGDALWVTPLARYSPGLVVQMRGTDAKTRATAPILDGLATVEFVNEPPETPKAPIRAHVTQQILASYGHAGKPSIPSVVLKPAEIQWAITYLAHKVGSPKMVALVNHCSGSWDPTNYRAQYVRGNPEAMVKIAAFWRGAGYKVVQFGPAEGFYEKDVFTPMAGNVALRGLTVRELAACYHVIGRLVSPDTGDYHLMVAVGGRAAVLTPPHSDQFGYRHWDLHYDAACWGDERPRVSYIEHKDWWMAMDTGLFKRMGGERL